MTKISSAYGVAAAGNMLASFNQKLHVFLRTHAVGGLPSKSPPRTSRSLFRPRARTGAARVAVTPFSARALFWINRSQCIHCLALWLVLAFGGATQAQVSLSLGDLAPGDSVTISYEVTINAPLSSGVTQISQQGTVSGDNFSSVNTDDPETAAGDDATVTVLAQDFDFGDAPDPLVATVGQYPTLLVNNGARHFIPAGGATLYLGAVAPDAETDGQPNAGGTGDDAASSDDEGGVTLPATFERNVATTLTVNVTGAGGKLNAWIDWNRDGDWSDAGEQIAADLALSAGAHIVNATPPGGTVSGTGFARFRLSSDSGLAPTGPASDGEVEDYAVTLVANSAPATVANSYTVAEGGTLAASDATGSGTPGDATDNGVLVNDTDVNGDALTAALVSGPSHASAFTLNANGTFTYTHDGGETTSDSFTYKANDGTSDGNTVTVSITVTPVNDNPVAHSDSLVRQRNGSAKIHVSQVLANDTDAELQTLSVTGVVSPNGNNATITLEDGWIIYEPQTGFNSADSFTYQISDGNGGTANGTVNVTIVPDSGEQTQNIISITASGADMIVRFAGIAGRTYQIQTTGSLSQPITWAPHPAGPQTAASNGIVEITDVAPPSPRFYRAVEN